MMKSVFQALFVILVLSAGYAFSQSATPTPRPRVDRLGNVRPPTDIDAAPFSRRTSIENLPPEYRVSSKAMKRTKFSDEEKLSFKDAKTGGVKMLKIFIAPKCAEKFVIDVSDPRCTEGFDFIPVSYYSFFDGTYGQLYGELRLLDGIMIAGNGRYVHGFLVDLGETADVGALDKKSPDVKKLVEYAVAKTSDDADKQLAELQKGIRYEGLVLASQQKIAPNHTYLMRIVAYGLPDEQISPYNYDSVVALRIAKLTDDRMAVIFWKKLAEKFAPRLQQNKK
jgi:hypothetical protein